MDNELMDRITSYKTAMAVADRFLKEGVISPGEYGAIDTIIAEKYGLSLCSIFREKRWINGTDRGNISH